MYRSLIAIRYAKALYLKGKEENILEDIFKDIEVIQKTLEEEKGLTSVFKQPTILPSKKRQIIDQIFEEHVNSITLDFLELVIQNKRESSLDDIFRNFNDLYNADKGIKSVLLTTTVELGDNEKENVGRFVTKNFDAKEIDLDVQVDKELIGGFIIQIEDQLFDASVKRQLEMIRRDFLHRKVNKH